MSFSISVAVKPAKSRTIMNLNNKTTADPKLDSISLSSDPYDPKGIHITDGKECLSCQLWLKSDDTLFSFPTNWPLICEKWLESVNLPSDYELKSTDCLCIKHFAPDDLIEDKTQQKVHLRLGAIPTRRVELKATNVPELALNVKCYVCVDNLACDEDLIVTSPHSGSTFLAILGE